MSSGSTTVKKDNSNCEGKLGEPSTSFVRDSSLETQPSKAQLFYLRPSLFKVFLSVGAELRPYTFKEVLGLLKNYIFLNKSIIDTTNPHIINCVGTPLGEALGIDKLVYTEVRSVVLKNLVRVGEPIYIPLPAVPEGLSGPESEYSYQGYETALCGDSEGTENSVAGDSNSLDDSDDAIDGVLEYEPVTEDDEKDNDQFNDSDSDVENIVVTVDWKESTGPDEDFFADDSESSSSECDPELKQDQWRCLTCGITNKPFCRYCFKCWKLRKDWYPEPSKRRRRKRKPRPKKDKKMSPTAEALRKISELEMNRDPKNDNDNKGDPVDDTFCLERTCSITSSCTVTSTSSSSSCITTSSQDSGFGSQPFSPEASYGSRELKEDITLVPHTDGAFTNAKPHVVETSKELEFDVALAIYTEGPSTDDHPMVGPPLVESNIEGSYFAELPSGPREELEKNASLGLQKEVLQKASTSQRKRKFSGSEDEGKVRRLSGSLKDLSRRSSSKDFGETSSRPFDTTHRRLRPNLNKLYEHTEGKKWLQTEAAQNLLQVLSSDDSDAEEEDRCTLCCVRPKNASIIHGKISHICYCYPCAKKLYNSNAKCPICRRKIYNVTKNYYINS